MNINNYTHDLFKLSINELISHYNEIELIIYENVKNLIIDYLIALNFKANQNILSKNKVHYKFLYEFQSNTRILDIKFVHLDKTERNVFEYPILIDINKFGLIKTILIGYSTFLKNDIFNEKFISLIKNHIINAYNSYEIAFELNLRELNSKIFDTLYAIIKTDLKNLDKLILLSKYRFVLFHENAGYYLFDEQFFRQAIDHFNKNQQDDVSPAQLLIWIITNPLPYDKSLSSEVLKLDTPLSIGWKEAKFISGASEFWQAASILYDFEDYTVCPICQHREYQLTSVFKSKYQDTFISLFSKNREILRDQFVRGLKEYSIFFKLLKKSQNIINDPSVFRFLGEFFAPILKELSKP